MTNNEKWNEFLSNLLTGAIKTHRESKEYEYQKQRQTQIDEFLSGDLTADQKLFVDQILVELSLFAKRELEVVYNQGIKDCVWLLKILGVLG